VRRGDVHLFWSRKSARSHADVCRQTGPATERWSSARKLQFRNSKQARIKQTPNSQYHRETSVRSNDGHSDAFEFCIAELFRISSFGIWCFERQSGGQKERIFYYINESRIEKASVFFPKNSPISQAWRSEGVVESSFFAAGRFFDLVTIGAADCTRAHATHRVCAMT
jgi:hypothetical protein